MPNFDGTGPAGQGARTGRGNGSCGGNVPGARGNRGNGRGMGMGVRTGGRVMSLEEQERQLQQQLDRVREAKKN